MAHHGAIQMMTMSTKSDRYWVKEELKIAYIVTPKAMTQSISTAWYRFTGAPIACSVTPDEYMSRLLIPKIWTMANNRKTTTNHGGMTLVWAKGSKRLRPGPRSFGTNVPTTAPSVMIRISGTAVPRKTQPTIAFFEVLVGQYRV